jgi:class 3 adenylate cyclase
MISSWKWLDKGPKLNSEELAKINTSLLEGVVSRATMLAWLFCVMYTIYGLSSIIYLRRFIPDLSMFDNLWPRFVFNSLPMLAIALYLGRSKKNPLVKTWVWIFGFPLVMMAAGCIFIYPLLWRGQFAVYSFVHAAHFFILAILLVMTAPPPKLLVAQALVYAIMDFGPAIFLFSRGMDKMYLKLILGDLAMGVPMAIYAGYMIHKVRFKVALYNLQMRKMTSPFLGATLTDAIYDERSDLLRDRVTDALVLVIDIRGYTDFYRHYQGQNMATARKFMSAYHTMVSRHVGDANGYWHKSVGDAHLASFGAMGPKDMVDLPDKQRTQFANALRAVFGIAVHFEQLKIEHGIEHTISLGIALAYGAVEVRIQGDENHKKELDIDGDVVIRCFRLESYSKVIRNRLAPQSSVLVLSPELSHLAGDSPVFREWSIDAEGTPVPNYPEIRAIRFHILGQSRSVSTPTTAA